MRRGDGTRTEICYRVLHGSESCQENPSRQAIHLESKDHAIFHHIKDSCTTFIDGRGYKLHASSYMSVT